MNHPLRIYKQKIKVGMDCKVNLRGFICVVSSGFAIDKETGYPGLFIWYKCRPTAHSYSVFEVSSFVTGEDIPEGALDDKKFLGTHVEASMGLVAHVFLPRNIPTEDRSGL